MVKAVQCGLKIDEFWGMTWREFSIYTTAWERNELNKWARTRKLAHMMFSTVATKEKWVSEVQWWPLPIDEKAEEKKPLTPEEIQAMISLLQTPQINKA